MKIQHVVGAVILSTTLVVANEVNNRSLAKDLGTMPVGFYSAGKQYVDIAHSGPSWKSLIAEGKVPYHRMTASDFKVDDEIKSENAVYTMGFIKFEYRTTAFPIGRQGWRAVIEKMKVASGLDRAKTWRRSTFNDPSVYLSHEQGHLDINELAARTFAGLIAKEKPIGTGSTEMEARASLQAKIAALFKEVESQNSREQVAYDNRTSRGWNQGEQVKVTSELSEKTCHAGIVVIWQPIESSNAQIHGENDRSLIY